MPSKLDLVGRTFTRLFVRGVARNQGRYTMWECECACGKVVKVATVKLTSGNTRSCGCFKRERIAALRRIDNPGAVFWTRVKVGAPDECWPWTGALNNQGYGSFMGKGAHVQAFLFCNGAIKRKNCVLHSCDNPQCCNPSHLFQGTHSDNSKDAWSKGRNFYQRHPNARPKGEKHKNAKLTQRVVRAIRREYATGNVRQIDLAKKYGSTQAGISQIIRNVSWREGGAP